jgi:hypothetical protein
MEPRELDELRRFLADKGAADLFEYLKLARDSSEEVATKAIKDRRAWAQARQSNAKYRQEALWLIKNVKLMRKVLLDERAAYLRELDDRDHARKADILRPFIQGAIAEGVLTSRAETAILDQGAALGLDEDTTRRLLDELVELYGARRATHSIPTDAVPFVDHYAVLGVPRDAELSAVEQAYQARYQAARQGKDPRQAEAQYARLDAAWATLKSPASRAAYDSVWEREVGDHLPTTGSVGAGPDAPPEPQLEAQTTPFKLKDEPASRPTLSLQGGPPPAPSGLRAQRTLDIGEGSAPVRVSSGPHIIIEGGERRELEVGTGVHEETLVVRKVGSGRLKARASCSPSEWSSVTPEVLSSSETEQTLTLRIDPSKMPSTTGTVRLVVASGLNERRTVTFSVARPRRLPWGAILGAGLVAAAAAAAAVLLPDWISPPEPPPPPTAMLEVSVDPPYGEVWVDGKLRSSEGGLRIADGLTEAGELSILVRREGFTEWTQTVEVTPGETTTVAASLELKDPMDFAPDEDKVEGQIDARETRSRLQARSEALERCLLDHARTPAGERYTVEIESLITPSGSIRGTRLAADPPPSKAMTACLHRELRAIPLPLFQGDYATHRTTVSVVVPAADAP